MVCIFCIAVFALVAGAITAERLDKIEEKLNEKSVDGVERTVDSESVARYELTVAVDGKEAEVSVTVFKDANRVRIQVITHNLTRKEVEHLEDELAEALEADIVERSDPEHEASAQHLAEHAAEDARAAQRTKSERAAKKAQKSKPKR